MGAGCAYRKLGILRYGPSCFAVIGQAVHHFAITTFGSGRWKRLPSCLIHRSKNVFYVFFILVAF